MLISLHIKNYAIIDEVRIEFSPRFTIITGETGAGKSILLGALGLLVGNRADHSVLSNQEEKCIVEGLFDIQRFGFEAFFRENDVDYQPATILRREILPGGKSRSFVNDTPVSLQFLKQLGEKIIDIHSQHQTLSLREDNFQLGVVDAIAANEKLADSYRASYKQFKATEARIQELEASDAARKQEWDFKKFLWDELDKAEVRAGEIRELEQEQAFLSHAEEIKTLLISSCNTLTESEEGIVNQLNIIKSQLGKISHVNHETEEVYQRLLGLLEEAKDLGRTMENLEQKTDLDPARLEWVGERLDLLNSLLQKHRLSDDTALIELKNRLETEIQALDQSGELLEKLYAEREKLKANMFSYASELHKTRAEAAIKLEKEINALLNKLQLPDAVFSVQIESGRPPGKDGTDAVQFLFSANKGMPAQDLGKVASGGEISRLMLAVKSVVSQRKNLPTIIFDEIDTGVSGLVADKVGQVMAELSGHLQVMAITHLPQIAGKGDLHLKVIKQEKNGKTVSGILELSREERIDELAKMLSGEQVTREAVDNAKVLLGYERNLF